jgi:PAS domain S-box-containing protein
LSRTREFPAAESTLVLSEVEELRLRLSRSEHQVELLQSTLRARINETLRADRTQRTSREFLRAVYRAMPGALLFIDEAGVIFDINDTFLAMLGRRPEEVIGSSVASWFTNLPALDAGELAQTECSLRARDREIPVLFSATSVQMPGERRRALVGVATDISDRKRMEADLQRAHKLESVGRLAAGVAHEINTPMQFVTDSVSFVQDSIAELLADRDDETATEITAALALAVSGLDRIAEIVQSMRVLAHPGRVKTAVDMDLAIRSVVAVAAGEYKLVADVSVEVAELPPVICHPGDINQALLNLIVNAGQAIAEVVGHSGERGALRVTARQHGDDVEIAIADTGAGIPDTIRDRIFDPFFTTKELGHGTGQGLAVAHAMICDLHGGTISVDTELGRGSVFRVRLPINAAGAP